MTPDSLELSRFVLSTDSLKKSVDSLRVSSSVDSLKSMSTHINHAQDTIQQQINAGLNKAMAPANKWKAVADSTENRINQKFADATEKGNNLANKGKDKLL